VERQRAHDLNRKWTQTELSVGRFPNAGQGWQNASLYDSSPSPYAFAQLEQAVLKRSFVQFAPLEG
jgi:hypothetical protein